MKIRGISTWRWITAVIGFNFVLNAGFALAQPSTSVVVSTTGNAGTSDPGPVIPLSSSSVSLASVTVSASGWNIGTDESPDDASPTYWAGASVQHKSSQSGSYSVDAAATAAQNSISFSPDPNGNGGDGADSGDFTLGDTFTSSGYYKITVSGDIWWWWEFGYIGDVPGSNTVDIYVTVVSVGGIQIVVQNQAYDVTKTLAAEVNKQMSLQAVPSPSDAPSWPSGKPTWGGTSGASGSGSSTSLTLTTTSSSASDYQTITVTCGNTVTANVICYAYTPMITPADNFAGRSLSDFGVAENASLSIQILPSDLHATDICAWAWTQTGGDGSLVDNGDGTGSYTVQDDAGAFTLTLTQIGPISTTALMAATNPSTKPATRNVVAPSSGSEAQEPGTGIFHNQGEAIVAFMGQMFIHPNDVSFKNIFFREDAVAAIVTGWYADPQTFQATGGPPAHKSGNALNVLGGNAQNGSMVAHDDQVQGAAALPPAFYAGTFEWDIPWLWRTPSMMTWRKFDTAIHIASLLDATGAESIQKQGAGPFTKQFNDPSSPY